MATYKLEIQRKFGSLQHRFYPSADPAPDFAGAAKDVNGLLEGVDAALEKAKVSGADTVIFRQIGYSNRGELREAVRTGK